MKFHILTIFPDIFSSYFNESILKRAQKENIIKIKIYNLRDWTTDKHKTVDDAPYGGGAGMIMKIDVLYKAISDIKNKISSKPNKKILNAKYLMLNTKTILSSAKGKTWNQSLARDYSRLTDIIIICGRYEGVDERITDFIDEEISIGDYVLTGGEIPAMAMVDSITRLLPGVLGNPKSLNEESFSYEQKINRKLKIENIKLEYPQYTRPEIFVDGDGREHKVPETLLSGNHAEIKKWQEQNMKKIKT